MCCASRASAPAQVLTLYTSNGWNLADVLNYSLLVVTLFMRLSMLHQESQLEEQLSVGISELRNNDSVFMYCRALFGTMHTYNTFTAINAVVLWLKFFKYIRSSPQLGFLVSVVQAAAGPVILFLVVLSLPLMGFAQAYHVLVGAAGYRYRTFTSSVNSVLLILVGNYDFNQLTGELQAPLHHAQSCVIVIDSHVIVSMRNCVLRRRLRPVRRRFFLGVPSFDVLHACQRVHRDCVRCLRQGGGSESRRDERGCILGPDCRAGEGTGECEGPYFQGAWRSLRSQISVIMLTQAHTSYAFKRTDTTPTAQIKSRLMEDLVCPGTPDNLREAADSVFESLAVRRRMQGDAHFKVYNSSHEETMDVDRFWVLSGQVCLTIRVQRVVSCVQRVASQTRP